MDYTELQSWVKEYGDLTHNEKVKCLKLLEHQASKKYSGYAAMMSFDGREYMIDESDVETAQNLGAKKLPVGIQW